MSFLVTGTQTVPLILLWHSTQIATAIPSHERYDVATSSLFVMYRGNSPFIWLLLSLLSALVPSWTFCIVPSSKVILACRWSFPLFVGLWRNLNLRNLTLLSSIKLWLDCFWGASGPSLWKVFPGVALLTGDSSHPQPILFFLQT